MKRLAMMRHAKSSWDDRQLDDFNRPLNDRGWKAAWRMGREMSARGMQFDLVLASAAARVRETIDGVQRHYDFGAAPIRFEPRLYGASEATLLEIVRALPESVRAPLLVGHNPGLERLIAELTGGIRKFPTAALAVVELPEKLWAEVEPGAGEIVELILPKELD